MKAVCCLLALFALAVGPTFAVAPPLGFQAGDPALAARAQAILRTHCYRCHGQDGAVEGGLNYVLDREKLVARRKIVPGQPEKSPLYLRVVKGKMPPPDVKVRPTADELALLRRWIEQGAGSAGPAAERPFVSETAVQEWILADLEKMDRRARRFARYFSLVPLANAGAGPDELKTYRNALAKLVNSLSWHPRISLPRAIDPAGLVLGIDLRDYQLDANLWNRLLNDYPYGILHDSGISRAVLIGTATRMPVVRADWFVASASRAPLYYDLLQIPGNLGELERLLRVDVEANIRQERVARAGFNGSGVSRNNRILERHDATTGAYWRTYDFEAVPQNLLDRNILLPDRRNIFAFPLGPGGAETQFQHAGGEVIFNLPNGLHGFVLVNATGVRVNKGPTDIVSDPRRPDRAVEAGLSCMHCHATGINPKDDQIRDHVRKNRKAFDRLDVELVEALYPPAKKMRQLMEEDSERFQKAVARTGNRASAAEVIMAMTLRYEADVDLPTLAAEVGVRPGDILPRLGGTDNLARNLGALKVPGGTVSRQVVTQAFGDLVKELKLGGVLEVGRGGEALADATGEVDPLEAQSSPANAMAFTRDGKLAAIASNNKSVRIFDVVADRDLRHGIGHLASVWCVAFSPDGDRLLSGGKDGTLRVWDVETARELAKINAHADLVSAIAFSPDGKRALSAGYDQELILWDLSRGERVAGFAPTSGPRYVHSLAFAPDGKSLLVAGERTLYLLDATTGKMLRRLEGHAGWIVQATFAAGGKRILSGSDDGTARLWDTASGKPLSTLRGHGGSVKAVASTSDGRFLLTGGNDSTVRLWEAETGKLLRTFPKHTEPVVAVTFGPGEGFTQSGSREARVLRWDIGRIVRDPGVVPRPETTPIKTVGTEEYSVGARPLASLPVGGMIGKLLLAPDRGSLYYLNLTESELGRVGTSKLTREGTVALLGGTEAIAMSPDGKTLVALESAPRNKPALSMLQWIDPIRMVRKADHQVPRRSHDLAVRDDGVVFLSGRGGDWTDVVLYDLRSRTQLGVWAGVWSNSLLQLTPDGRRLYTSSQGVVPGTLDVFAIPERFDLRGKLDEKPVMHRAPGHDKLGLGGAFTISPEGKYLLCRTGTVLKLSPDKDDDMRAHARIERHLSVAIDVEGGRAFVVALDGTLGVYSYPDLRLLGRHRLGLTAYEAVVDGKAGRLYVGGFDSRSLADRPRARGHGEIHVYALDGLRAAKR